MRKFLPLTVICLILFHGILFAQDSTRKNNTAGPLIIGGGSCTITGPTDVVAQDTDVYSFSCTVGNVNWIASGGDVVSVSSSTVTVHWGLDLSKADNTSSWAEQHYYAVSGPNVPFVPAVSARLATTMSGSLKALSSTGATLGSINVTINSVLIAGTISPASQTIAYNGVPDALSCSAATGGIGIISYQWQYSTDNNNWFNIAGATGLNFTPGNLITTTYYRVQATQKNRLAISNTATVSVTGGSSSPSLVTAADVSPIDLSKPVGSANGDITSNNAGGISYGIPINILPGSNGMQPSVGLQYNSKGGNGIAGWGWSLGPFSQITRTGKNFYYNGSTTPVSFSNAADAFVLDGQRLFPVSGINGGDSTIYGQEHENFSVIKSYGGSATTDPDYFSVVTKTGTTIEYGGVQNSKFLTDDGQHTMVWLIDKVTDKNGNYYTFSYNIDQINRAYVLTEIDYTGNSSAGLSAYNKILFRYALRNNLQINKSFISGYSLSNPYLLDKISVENKSDSVLSSYQASYSILNGTYFLRSFTETGADGSVLNPLQFVYGAAAGNPDVSVSPAIPVFAGADEIFTSAGDFEGTGKHDVMVVYDSVDDNLNTHNIGYDIKSIWDSAGTPAFKNLYSERFKTAGNIVAGNRPNNYLSNDYDGDGKADALFTSYTASGSQNTLNQIQINYTRNFSAGNWSYDSAVYAIPSGYTYIADNFIIPGDFDGDGIQDYILMVSATPTSGYKAFFNSPKRGILNKEITNFGVEGTPGSFYASSVSKAATLTPVDMDGDGKTDIFVQKSDSSYALSINSDGQGNYSASVIASTAAVVNGYPVFPGDFNGDGKTDFLYRTSATDQTASWNILYSTGTGFKSSPFSFLDTPLLASDPNAGINATPLMVADVNQDGKADIWMSKDIAASSSKHTLYFGAGTPADGAGANTAFIAHSDTVATSVDATANTSLTTGDFNGDGNMDIMVQQNTNYKIIYTRPFKEEQRLVKALNGLGAETDVTYDLLNNSAIYTRSNTYLYDQHGLAPGQQLNGNPYNVIDGPLYVVKQLTQPNGIGSTVSFSYTYRDALFHPMRGLLGFKQIAATNTSSGVSSVSLSDVNTHFFLPHIIEQYLQDTASDTIAQTYISDTLLPASTITGDFRYIYQLNKKITLNGLTGAGSETDNTYDSYGNITSQTINAGSYSGTTIAPTLTTATTTIYGTYGASSVPAYPTSITVTSTRSGKPSLSKQTTIAYDTKGNPATSVSFAGTANAVTSTYQCDAFGNDTSLVVAASGVNNRVSGTKMDTQGRFILTRWQTGSGITKTRSFTYNDWGSSLTKKSSAGLTTTIQYDGFNRPSQITTPEGYNITTSYAWDSTTGRYSVSVSRPGGGSNTKTWYDVLGRTVQKQVSGYNGQNLTQTNTYNALGQLASAVKPHYSSETAVTTTYTYDNDNRTIKVASPVNYVTYAYAKLSGGQFKVTATNSAGQSSSKTTDATGAVVSSADNGGTVNFDYDSWGNQLTATTGGKTMIANVYNNYGQKTSTTDINTGAYTYQYDALGQLIKQTDPLDHVYNLTYDDFGRLLTKAGAEGTTTYTYYTNTSTGYNSDQITKITGFDGEETDYTYDNLMRPQTKKVTIDATSYTTTFGYDAYSNPISVTYPDGLVINSTFDNNGILTQKTMQSGSMTKTLFTATAMNSAGVYTGYSLGNGKTSTVTYDLTENKPTRIYTAGIQDLNFVFNANTGNLDSREDAINNLTETFTYDSLNRLTGSKLNNVPQLSLQYDNAGGTSFGNITQKSDAGNYVYNTTKINQLSYITDTGSNQMLPPPNISQNTQQIGYTPFLMTDSVAQNGYAVHFTYAYDDSRIKSVLSQSGSTVETRYYFGDFEKQVKGATTRYIHYITAGNGISSIVVAQGSAATPYFVYSDYLGSILTVTDSVGNIAAQQNFDAWGRNRNPANWTYTNIPTVPDWLYRGYTGHEMLPQFALINMNGRMYDPIIGKMLAPDINIPNPYSAVGYNRYDYAFNNPLLFSDPTGETFASWAEFWTATLNIMNVMRSEGYVSATWQDGGGGGGSVTYSKSDANAFAANAQYMTDNGLWGTNGFASSLGSAQFNYYLNGGKDPNVAYITVNKPIVVLGKIINNLWQTSHVFYPGQYTEDKNGMITITLPGEDPMEGQHWYNWNGPIARWLFPDKLSISMGADMTAFLGIGTQPMNFTLLTRGKAPGLYLTPSLNADAGLGLSASGGFNFGIGYYTGDPANITPNMLRGYSYGITATGGVIGDLSVGGSYSPAIDRNGGREGFIDGNVGIGVGLGAFVGGQYQYTPQSKPIFQW